MQAAAHIAPLEADSAATVALLPFAKAAKTANVFVKEIRLYLPAIKTSMLPTGKNSIVAAL